MTVHALCPNCSATVLDTGKERFIVCNKCGRKIHSRVYGEKNAQGFIIDFSILKSYLLEIAGELDHRILIPEKNKNVVVEENQIRINFENKKYILPREDCVLLPIESTTTENLAEYILEKLFKKINQHDNIKKIEIGLDEGIGQGIKLEKIVG